MKESEVTCAHDIAVRHTTNSNKQGIIIAGILIADALDRVAACLPAPKPAAPKAKKIVEIGPRPDLCDFNGFWDVWPLKTAKVAAKKAWRKLAPSPELIEAILADVVIKTASKKWRESGGDFIPHPATYLNGRRWEDEGVETGDGGGSAGKEAY